MKTMQPAPVSHSAAARRRLIVDAQVHMWTAETPDWPWVKGLPPQLPEPFTAERLLPLMDKDGVDRVVIVPPMWPGDRNDYALDVARRFPDRFAVMGRIALADPRSRGRLPTWREQTGLLGVRLTFLEHEAGYLDDGTADWLWPAAEAAQVPVMVHVGAHLPRFADIAARHPALTLIIDHVGMSARRPITESATQAIALAKYPNVSVKIKAGAQYVDEPYPYPTMAVELRRVIEAFGPRRCHWETDITQTLHHGGYQPRIAQFTEAMDFLSEDDKDWIMGRAILERLRWS